MGQKRGKCCPCAPRLPVCNASPRADLQVGQLFPSPDYMGRPGGFARFIMCFPCSLTMRPSSEKTKNHQRQNKCLYLGAKILMHIEIQSETHDAQSGHWHPFKPCKTGNLHHSGKAALHESGNRRFKLRPTPSLAAQQCTQHCSQCQSMGERIGTHRTCLH